MNNTDSDHSQSWWTSLHVKKRQEEQKQDLKKQEEQKQDKKQEEASKT